MNLDNLIHASEIGSFALSLVVIILSLLSIYYRSTIKLLADGLPAYGVNHSVALRYVRAVWTLVGMQRQGIHRESLFNTARQRIEVEVVRPRPILVGPASRSDRKAHRAKVREWREFVSDQLGQLSDEGPKPIQIKNTTLLIKNTDDVKRYFEALKRQRSNLKQEFYTLLNFESGFVAPLRLMTGLIAKYEENWAQIVEAYGEDITRPNDDLRRSSLRKFQAFTFDCWLLWGPSIPICNCEQWEGVVALQFGYGDENNSIAVYGASPGDVMEKLHMTEPHRIARKVTVTGRLQWGPAYSGNTFCPAQISLQSDDEEDLLIKAAGIGRDVMIEPAGDNVSAKYYSAYIWIIFAMCDDNGVPFHSKESEFRWRDLIPFFIHGNIADLDTYDMQTSELARSSAAAMVRLVNENKDKGLKFRFACAIDETACGGSMIVSPPGATIRSKMEEFIVDAPPGSIKLAPFDRADPFERGALASCALPAIVKSYYDHLDKKQKRNHG
ncbi:hypothetical protein [Nocardia sp. NPDC006630]|uniref:hypothetical protein n=1 Tax=Nocardia sp. NPDC006630 TaxID=3157181 RepID=UPI00339EBACC